MLERLVVAVLLMISALRCRLRFSSNQRKASSIRGGTQREKIWL